ncbi:hypothetical protein [Bradyrhizobium stylosanthis]|uniref:Uncharacterized protein n=1 Tax=Bradyrhizobium stylosanthis TaxID=1803665 RepID=A0A560DN99_9BRAD|nr:hypothetical protein [Bradyrhizobium stylosanthis]TWA98593.1 hypothetical protein FBZ96_105271 [Bradyrhizobium stylosanthis]
MVIIDPNCIDCGKRRSGTVDQAQRDYYRIASLQFERLDRSFQSIAGRKPRTRAQYPSPPEKLSPRQIPRYRIRIGHEPIVQFVSVIRHDIVPASDRLGEMLSDR